MKFVQEKALRDYIKNGDETTRVLLNGPDDLVDAIEFADKFFRQILWEGEHELRVVPAFPAMNAFMYIANRKR